MVQTAATSDRCTKLKKRKSTTPPGDYVCLICKQPGHWIQQCPEKTKSNKRRKKNNPGGKVHIHIPGVDPSQSDIDRARELQKIPPPNCFCGIPSRLKKVKKSSTGEHSRAIGCYFFFCSKQKRDDSKCRFARPVEDEVKPKKERLCAFFAKNGKCKKGDKCLFSHDLSLKKKENGTDENDKNSAPEVSEEQKKTKTEMDNHDENDANASDGYSSSAVSSDSDGDDDSDSSSSSSDSDSSSSSSCDSD